MFCNSKNLRHSVLNHCFTSDANMSYLHMGNVSVRGRPERPPRTQQQQPHHQQQRQQQQQQQTQQQPHQNAYSRSETCLKIQSDSESDYDSVESDTPGINREHDNERTYRRYIRPRDLPKVIANGDTNQNCDNVEGASDTAVMKPWKEVPIPERKPRRKTWRFLLVGLTSGFILGLIVCALSWLLVGKLRDTNVVCVIKQNDNVVQPPSDSMKTTTATTNTAETTPISDTTRAPDGISSTKTVTFATSTHRPSTVKEKSSTSDSSVLSSSTVKPSTSRPSDISTDSEKNRTLRFSTGDVTTITNNTPFAQTSTGLSTSTTTGDNGTATTVNLVTGRSSTMSPINTTLDTNSSVTKANISTPVSPSASSSTITAGGLAQDHKMSIDAVPGCVYTRWGRFSCPDHSEQIYRGYMAGGHYKHPGGATNTICLPEVPEWGNHSDTADLDRALVYGTEYGSNDDSFKKLTGKKIRNKDAPCVVCQATGRISQLMIPAKTSCVQDWTEEYNGYLMGSSYLHSHASQLICVDSKLDHVTGSDAVKGGHYLFYAEIRTGSLPSPPYFNGREIPCVVCTK